MDYKDKLRTFYLLRDHGFNLRHCATQLRLSEATIQHMEQTRTARLKCTHPKRSMYEPKKDYPRVCMECGVVLCRHGKAVAHRAPPNLLANTQYLRVKESRRLAELVASWDCSVFHRAEVVNAHSC